ncbi:hypothetical protein STANM309S_01680 [Streptomyces tanashiensis]
MRRSGDAAAAEWLAKLPGLADEALGHASLDTERVMAPGGRSSLVVLVRRSDGSPAALKIAPPVHPAGPGEGRAGALERLGRGAAPRRGRGGRARPRTTAPRYSLRSLPEAKALLEAAGTVRKLWVEPRRPTASRRWPGGRQAGGGDGAVRADPAAGELTAAALAVREELVAAEAETVLLHGNFQGKVLAGDRTPWLAVGPEPLVGERAYDLARLVRDRVEDLVAASSGASAARRRVNKLADSPGPGPGAAARLDPVPRGRVGDAGAGGGAAAGRRAASGVRELAVGEYPFCNVRLDSRGP